MMYCRSISTRYSYADCGSGVWHYPIILLITTILVGVSMPSLSESESPEATHQRGGVGGVSQDKRVALVIGNSAYQQGSPLPNALNDARDMAAALRELGFTVIPGENLDRRAMEDAIITFGERLQGEGVSLFYYAGHGTQVSGVNYLIPIKAQITKEQHISSEAVPLTRVLQAMEMAENQTNIVILDACRNNPFVSGFRSPRLGLAPVLAPKGMLIAYATDPGNVASDGERDARNGLYTAALLQHLRMADVEILDVFKRVGRMVHDKSKGEQVPWINTSLYKDVYLAPSSLALYGHLQVQVNVDTAYVRINGVEAGIARREEPLRVRREAGTHTVRVEADGYEPVERPVTIAVNEWTREPFVLQRRVALPEKTLTPQPVPAASPQPVSPPNPRPQPEAQSPENSVIIWAPDPKTGKLLPQQLPPDQSAGGSGKTQKK